MILDGKKVAEEMKQELKELIAAFVKIYQRPPSLTIISVGDDPASKIYVRNKIKAAEEVGIEVDHLCFDADGGEFLIREVICHRNLNPKVDGIMVQLPLPQGYNEREIIDTICPWKDVDGLTTTNIGRLRSGQPCLKPCTAAGIIDLCKYYNIELDGKDVTIVGRSNIVGKPLADLMMAEGATVMQCHSKTRYLADYTLYADIVISAIGKPKYFDAKYFGSDQTVIDVGINRDEDGKLCGDIDFEDVRIGVDNITPVPGGVGPMTVVELLKNTLEAAYNNVQ